MSTTIQTAYLAPIGLENELKRELKDVTHVFGRLILAQGPAQQVYWAQNIWHDPVFLPIASIGDAAKALRSIQRNWWPYHFEHHRRMKLIQEKLPHLAPKPLAFLAPAPTSPMGSWTLTDENTLLYASQCSSPMPNGEWNFQEDKENPPSRAYLKLWELFTRTGVYPKKTDVCLDLGASPGGWTWVLSQLSKKVYAFDRSPLEDTVTNLRNVEFKAQDAFKVDPAQFPQATWILSDVVCYPDKLFDHISSLLLRFPDKNYVFSVKFQGSDHQEMISRFAGLPGHLIHLCNNKHELTWYKFN
jgi:23S rRNA (cytidine2498-2'-O)-methyltransferase